MQTQLDKQILLDFNSLTGFNIQGLVDDFIYFIENDYHQIESFYKGLIKNNFQDSFKNLNNLRTNIDLFFETFRSFNTQLTSYKWWILIDEFEKLNSVILSIENLSKWLRSSVVNQNYGTEQVINSFLQQNQTLEDFSRQVEGSLNPLDDWRDVAVRNNLSEEDYTTEGGNELLFYKQNGDSIFIESVVDNIVGEKILGKDILYKTTFENDDLLVLSYKDTFFQSVNILMKLKKGDNPEFYDLGLQKNVAVGSNINSISYPVLLRQISEAFQTDDTIKSQEITGFRKEQDAIFIDMEIESKMSTIVPLTLTN